MALACSGIPHSPRILCSILRSTFGEVLDRPCRTGRQVSAISSATLYHKVRQATLEFSTESATKILFALSIPEILAGVKTQRCSGRCMRSAAVPVDEKSESREIHETVSPRLVSLGNMPGMLSHLHKAIHPNSTSWRVYSKRWNCASSCTFALTV